MRKNLIRLQLKHMAVSAWDRILDLWNLTLPIFITSGVLVACFKFWLWVLA